MGDKITDKLDNKNDIDIEEMIKQVEQKLNEEYPRLRNTAILFKGLSDTEAEEIFTLFKKRILFMVKNRRPNHIITGEIEAHLDSDVEKFRCNLKKVDDLDLIIGRIYPHLKK